MKNRQIFWVALLLTLPFQASVSAQSFKRILERPVNVIDGVWEQNSEGDQMLNYYNNDYCYYYMRRINDDGYVLRPGKTTVYTRKKNAQYDNLFKSGASQYQFYRGRFLKDFKIDTPYAFPVKNGGRTAWVTDKRERVRTLQFSIQPGDTVYATRGGMACDTVDERLLLIAHADYTFAAYMAMRENFIISGEYVRVGQPVGIAGPTGVSISFFFLDKNKFDGLDANGYVYSHFTPTFRTVEGDVKPEEKKMYEALLDDALIMQDMSKREQKRYLKNKK